MSTGRRSEEYFSGPIVSFETQTERAYLIRCIAYADVKVLYTVHGQPCSSGLINLKTPPTKSS